VESIALYFSSGAYSISFWIKSTCVSTMRRQQYLRARVGQGRPSAGMSSCLSRASGWAVARGRDKIPCVNPRRGEDVCVCLHWCPEAWLCSCLCQAMLSVMQTSCNAAIVDCKVRSVLLERECELVPNGRAFSAEELTS
jgi:hypothetical protein